MAQASMGLYNGRSSETVHSHQQSIGTLLAMSDSLGENQDAISNEPINARSLASFEAISIVQRGNLKTLEQTLRKQWRMGQNIVLCWSADERGLLVIFVPHYFLGNYCASEGASASENEDNERFIRDLISGTRQKTREDMFEVSKRLDVSPTFIKLKTALTEEPQVLDGVEELIKRYGISYVESRAVVLFDIVDFSLYTPFEQASQLNSLSYSLNSACNKLLAQGIEINFARTTTGDGYYIWNRDLSSRANQDLFIFMLLVVADNAVASRASKGNTVPVVRTGYHIGGHYELYQAEGINPSVFSYIVGDVTIELARMLDLAQAHQVLVGEFHCPQAGWGGSSVKSITSVSATSFVNASSRALSCVSGVALSSKTIEAMSCHLTESLEKDGESRPRRFRIVDKHGLSRYAYNLQIEIGLADEKLSLGLDDSSLPSRTVTSGSHAPHSAEEMIDDLSSLLRKRSGKVISED